MDVVVDSEAKAEDVSTEADAKSDDEGIPDTNMSQTQAPSSGGEANPSPLDDTSQVASTSGDVSQPYLFNATTPKRVRRSDSLPDLAVRSRVTPSTSGVGRGRVSVEAETETGDAGPSRGERTESELKLVTSPLSTEGKENKRPLTGEVSDGFTTKVHAVALTPTPVKAKCKEVTKENC